MVQQIQSHFCDSLHCFQLEEKISLASAENACMENRKTCLLACLLCCLCFCLRPLSDIAHLIHTQSQSMCAIIIKLHKNYDAVKTENKRHKAHIHQNESNNFISLLLFKFCLYFYQSRSISISISLVITGFQFQMRYNERTTASHFKCRCNLSLDSIAIIE